MGKDDITTRANSAAYSFFLSLFPSLLFILTLLPLLPIGAGGAALCGEQSAGIFYLGR